MKVVKKDIDNLIFSEYNPRRLSAEQEQNLTESIKRFGLVDPIIVNIHPDRENVIIGGHQRVKIAKKLDYSGVPCVEVKLDQEKERELNIRLNKNLGKWDWKLLEENFDFGELEDWGFDEIDFVKIKFEPEYEPGIDRKEVTEDEIDEKRKELEEHFKDDVNKIPIVCPYCNEEFYIKK